MINIIELATSGIMDCPYPEDLYHIDKLVHNRKPKYYNNLKYTLSTIMLNDPKYDIAIHSRGILNGSVNDILETNYLSVIKDIEKLAPFIKTQIIFGSICGKKDGAYPSHPVYEATKKLLRVYCEEHKDMDLYYLYLPGIKTDMTKTSSGYESYFDKEIINRRIFNLIDCIMGNGCKSHFVDLSFPKR